MRGRGYECLVVAVVIGLVLTSCSGRSSPVAASSNPPSPAAVPATSTPSLTPTAQPTGTPTPEGATEYDPIGHRYLKAADGKTYEWLQIAVNRNDTAGGHWFEFHMAGGSIPMIDGDANIFQGYGNLIPMRLYFEEGLPQLTGEGYLYHPDGASFYSNQTQHYESWMLRACSFTSRLVPQLASRVTGHTYNTRKANTLTTEDQVEVLQMLRAGSLQLKFNVATDTLTKGSDAQRVEYVWNVSQGYDVYVVPWEQADPAVDPTFTESEAGYSRVRWKVLAIEGRLVSIIASSAPVEVKDVDFIYQILAGLAAVGGGEDVPSGKYGIYDAFGTLRIAANEVLGKNSCTFTSSGVSVPILPHIKILSNATAPTPPPTPTIAPTIPVEAVYPGLQVTAADAFDDSNGTGWLMDSTVASIKDGVLTMQGNNWRGVSYSAQLAQGDGVIINFKHTPDAEFQAFLETGGSWGEPTYKRFGVFIYGDRIDSQVIQGRDEVIPQAKIPGNLILNPGGWYTLLLQVGQGGKFRARVWSATNPANTSEFRPSLLPVWSDLRWTFTVQGNQGGLSLDDFKQVVMQSP